MNSSIYLKEIINTHSFNVEKSQIFSKIKVLSSLYDTWLIHESGTHSIKSHKANKVEVNKL